MQRCGQPMQSTAFGGRTSELAVEDSGKCRVAAGVAPGCGMDRTGRSADVAPSQADHFSGRHL